MIVHRTLFRYSFVRATRWRRFLLGVFGAKLAPHVNVRSTARVAHPWLLTLGEYSTIADDVEVYNLGPISIGDHTVVSQGAYLCAGTHDYVQPSRPLLRPPIVIGNGVWVCAQAFIGPGVTIGDNSIVGARAVVTRDVAEGVIVAGNPARVIKPRPMPSAPLRDPTRPLRVLHIVDSLCRGGIAGYIVELGRAMKIAGQEVIIAGADSAWRGMCKRASLDTVETPVSGGVLSLIGAARRLERGLAEWRPDVIHTHYRRATIVGRLLQRRLAKSGRRPPLLYTLHLSDLAMGFPRRMLSDFGDHVHVASADACQWMVDTARYPADRITLIPHGIQVERFPVADESARVMARREFDLGETATVAAYVGRLDYPKNVDWLLDLAGRMPSLQLLIAGDGPDRPVLESAIANRGLGGRVRLLGERDPQSVYAAADVLLLPSLREGFSYVCGEAMSCGTPVLRTRTAGTTELIVEDVTGRSCAIEHEAFVSAAMAMLSLPRERLRQMGQAAAEHVRAHLRFEDQVKQTIELYERLCGR